MANESRMYFVIAKREEEEKKPDVTKKTRNVCQAWLRKRMNECSNERASENELEMHDRKQSKAKHWTNKRHSITRPKCDWTTACGQRNLNFETKRVQNTVIYFNVLFMIVIENPYLSSWLVSWLVDSLACYIYILYTRT